jgi:hypothetical protein
MTEHPHREFVPGCYRCDLSRAEAEPEVCEFCLEPVREHTLSEFKSCQADLRAIEENDRG